MDVKKKRKDEPSFGWLEARRKKAGWLNDSSWDRHQSEEALPAANVRMCAGAEKNIGRCSFCLGVLFLYNVMITNKI